MISCDSVPLRSLFCGESARFRLEKISQPRQKTGKRQLSVINVTRYEYTI